MIISERLSAIAKMVPKCDLLADVGCDHGFLSIYLCEQGIANHIYASDINEGPISRAREHIAKAGLSNRIDTVMSDGLKGIDRADVIVIAGMGGPLMLKILRDSEDVTAGASSLILQPQSELREFRFALAKMCLNIVEENFIIEDNKYYPMMRCEKGTMELSEVEAEYGPRLLKEKNENLKRFLLWERSYKNQLLKEVESNNTDKSISRADELRKEIKRNEEALEYYVN